MTAPQEADYDHIRLGDEFKDHREKTFLFAQANGLLILPMEPLSKSTLGADHLDYNWHPDKASSWSNEVQIDLLNRKPALNVGVLFADNVVDIDVDTTDAMIKPALKHYLGPIDSMYKWGRDGKHLSHIAYALKDPFDRTQFSQEIKTLARYEPLKLEIRGGERRSNFFSLMPGSIHNTGELVKWHKSFDPRTTPAPLGDVRVLLTRLRRAQAAALTSRYVSAGNRHYFFLALTGMLVRMWKQAEDSGQTDVAMDQDHAIDFFKFVQELAGDEDHRVESFNQTWRKFMDDPTIPISGGKKLAEIIGGTEGTEVRNQLYRLLVDDQGFEQAEAALERFVMVRLPAPGFVDLETLKPHEPIAPPLTPEHLSTLFSAYRIPFGDKMVPLPAFLRSSTQVPRAIGFSLRPDLQEQVYKEFTTEEDHGYASESQWVNCWTGYAYQPAKFGVSEGDIEPFLDYVANTIAGGIHERFVWVMSWLADIFQDPAHKPGTLLTLTGVQGSGKTMLGEIIGRIIGEAHYGKVGSIEDLTKEFNSRTIHKLMIQADETASTQKTSISRDLKELVTGEFQQVVYKGKEAIKVRNPARYFFTSNASGDALRVEAGSERRYTIFEVSPEYAGNMKFWEEFVRWWQQPATLRMIHRYLADYKYDKLLIRRAMATAEKRQHQINALPPVVQWLLTRTSEGFPLAAQHHEYSYQAYFAKKVMRGASEYVSPAPGQIERIEWPNLVELGALNADFFDWLKTTGVKDKQSPTAVNKLLIEINGGVATKYHSIRAKRDGIDVRPKLRSFPTREEVVAGLRNLFPSVAEQITAACEVEVGEHMLDRVEEGEF